ncbi:ABC transporter permease [Cesiribacter andamanensis]|uniref:Lipoprotein-releasing system transmembrane protein lolE n=1 Tax=Cesiribacter andamanensis AMV16 TaxID=1279009 RepID=M7P168_9BACT|nr:ABC transporter permease [Cesiribacter andamanensis]EMR04334.1 Lipoprotein-releasing system transmembrane protein lolE [Cesiribacter andamanensis AMV16]
MNLSFFIARRYFRSKKKKTFINIISIISMLVVAVGTMALIIVLSVFNGLEDLIRSLYNAFDAELRIVAERGKTFELTPELLNIVRTTEGVAIITEVAEDNALIRYQDAEKVAKVKGVSQNFLEQGRMQGTIVQGDLALTKGEFPVAIIGAGVRNALSVALENDFYALRIYYPRNVRPGTLDPSKYYVQQNIRPGAIFSIEKQYDENYVFVPLDFALKLFDYGNRRTALEIKTTDEMRISRVQRLLKERLPAGFVVQNSDEQHSSLLKAIKIEKLFVYLAFTFILAVASFNIFFSLTMLALDKQRDIAILFSMGASPGLVRKIFLYEGAIIAFTGAILGTLLGVLIVLVQERYGLVGMGMQTSVESAYPVKLMASDLLFTAISTTLITLLASFHPASLAARTDTAQHV